MGLSMLGGSLQGEVIAMINNPTTVTPNEIADYYGITILHPRHLVTTLHPEPTRFALLTNEGERIRLRSTSRVSPLTGSAYRVSTYLFQLHAAAGVAAFLVAMADNDIRYGFPLAP
jgi:hypothetical protein